MTRLHPRRVTVARVEVRSLGFRTDVMVRRLAGSVVADGGTHLIVRTSCNPTYYWGNFLLFPSAPQRGEAERWLTLFAREFPAAGHVAIGIDGPAGELGEIAGLCAAGLSPEVETVMTAAVLRAPARLNRDAEFRRLGEGDWGQVLALRRAIAWEEGLGSTEHSVFLERRTDEARQLNGSGHAAYFGAFVDGVLRSWLGLVTDGAGLGRFQHVETHPDHRRRGLASTLVHRAGSYGARQLGASKLVIVADPDGPALGIYRSLGFVEVERQAQLTRVMRSSPDGAHGGA